MKNRRVYHVVRCQDSSQVWYSCPTCGNVIAIESSTHKKNKKTSQWKKASLRSQDGGFTPQLDNTRQIFEDSKSWLWFSNASSVKRRTCATGLTKCVGLGGRYRRGRLMYYSSLPQLTCVLPTSALCNPIFTSSNWLKVLFVLSIQFSSHAVFVGLVVALGLIQATNWWIPYKTRLSKLCGFWKGR